jgi:hypothetical protein
VLSFVSVQVASDALDVFKIFDEILDAAMKENFTHGGLWSFDVVAVDVVPLSQVVPHLKAVLTRVVGLVG